MNPMGVEANAWSSDRQREEQPTSARQYALELGAGAACPVGSELIAVATKADVLGDMEA